MERWRLETMGLLEVTVYSIAIILMVICNVIEILKFRQLVKISRKTKCRGCIEADRNKNL